MRPIVLLLVLISSTLAPAGAAPCPVPQRSSEPNIYVIVNSRQNKAANDMWGEGTDKTLRDAMEHELFVALKQQYPCIHYLDESAARQMIDVERQRQLLSGSEDDSRLKALADSIGARYVGWVDINIVGGTVYVNGGVLNGTSGRTVARAQGSSAADNDTAERTIKQVAGRLAASLGENGMRCPGPWKGTVTITRQTSRSGVSPATGKPFTDQSSMSVTCSLKGTGGDAQCSVTYSGSTEGNDAYARSQGGDTVEAVVDVGAGDESSVSVSQLQIVGKLETNQGGGPYTMRFGPWTARAASTGNANQSSGSWSGPDGTKITWSFSRQ